MIFKKYPGNGRGTYAEMLKDHNGVTFVIAYKGSARFCRNPDEVRKVFGVARNQESVKDLVAWCRECLPRTEEPASQSAPSALDVTDGPPRLQS